MKTTGTTRWTTPNTGATNQSGFAGLPGGIRGGLINGFYEVGIGGFWWSATAVSAPNAWYRSLDYTFGELFRYNTDRPTGLSVRCLRD